MESEGLLKESIQPTANSNAKSSLFGFRFIALAILFLSDLAVWVVVFLKGLSSFSLAMLVFMFLGLFFLCALAKSGFQVLQAVDAPMHRTRIEKGPQFEELRGANQNTVFNSLLFVFALAGCLLAVLIELVFSH